MPVEPERSWSIAVRARYAERKAAIGAYPRSPMITLVVKEGLLCSGTRLHLGV